MYNYAPYYIMHMQDRILCKTSFPLDSGLRVTFTLLFYNFPRRTFDSNNSLCQTKSIIVSPNAIYSLGH